jgi:hypothetical protein
LKSKHMLQFAVAVALTALSATGFAQGQGGVTIDSKAGGGVSSGLLLSSHMFYYADQSSLGDDELKDGNALYMRFDGQYNWTDYFAGLGLFYEMDSFGKAQKDTIIGPIVELVAGSFFVKIMPLGSIKQQFTDRSFSERAGTFTAFEAGIRGNFYGGFMFYEVTLHRRTATITQEDGRDMTDKYSRTETFPMLGGGFTL